jgi:hypothetical protein
MRTVWGRLAGGLRTRPGAIALALSSLLFIAGGVAVDGWMSSLPSNVATSCTESGGVTSCAMRPNPAVQLWVGLMIAALGMGLWVLAWKLDRRAHERPRQGWGALRAWGAPLLWLAAVPVVALPVAFLLVGWEVREPTCKIYAFIGATAECPVSALVPSVLVPGLLNLVPLLWLRNADQRTRIAAIAASVLGLAGLVGSMWGLLAQGPVVTIDYGIFLPPLPPPGASGLGFGTVVWLSSLIALLVIAKIPLGAVGGGARTDTEADPPGAGIWRLSSGPHGNDRERE